jgi:hypothetical protein
VRGVLGEPGDIGAVRGEVFEGVVDFTRSSLTGRRGMSKLMI